MEFFDDIEEVEDWLVPMDYEEFWRAVEPLTLDIAPRDICDADIAAGIASKAVILDAMKSFARVALQERHGLRRRVYHPYASALH